MVYEQLDFYATDQKFYFHHVASGQILSIDWDRVNQEVRVESHQGPLPPASHRGVVLGIVGVARLIACPYVIVINRRKSVGTINGERIWKMEGFDVLPIPMAQMRPRVAQQIAFNEEYLDMIREVSVRYNQKNCFWL